MEPILWLLVGLLTATRGLRYCRAGARERFDRLGERRAA